MYNLLLLNWYLLGVEMNLVHAHKTRFWYLLGVFSKFSDEHPRHFYRGVSPGKKYPFDKINVLFLVELISSPVKRPLRELRRLI